MAQRIDLYRPELDLRRELPVWGRVVLAIAVSLLAGLALWMAASHERTQLQQTLAAAESEHARAAAQLEQLHAMWEAPEVERLERRVEQAESRAATLEAARELLDTRLSHAREFSLTEPLTALARSRHEAVWITAVRLDGRERALELSGRALTPDTLPDYIATLQQDGFTLARTAPELQARAENGHIVFQYRFGEPENEP